MLKKCVRWCWEDNSIVIREGAVILGLYEIKQSHSHQTVSVTLVSLHTYTARHMLVHGYTHVPSH